MMNVSTSPLPNDAPAGSSVGAKGGDEEEVKFYEKTSFKVGVVVAAIFLALLSLVILPYAIKGAATVTILTAGAFVAFFKSCAGIFSGDTGEIPLPRHRSGSPRFPALGGGGPPPPSPYAGHDHHTVGGGGGAPPSRAGGGLSASLHPPPGASYPPPPPARGESGWLPAGARFAAAWGGH